MEGTESVGNVAPDGWLQQFAVLILGEPFSKVVHNAGRLAKKHTLKTKRVHKTRIELRRLRSQLSNFKPCFAIDDYDLVKAAIRNFNQALAAIREMDVFAIELSQRMQQSYTHPVYQGLTQLVALAELKRQDLGMQLLAANTALLASEGWGLLASFLAAPDEDCDPTTNHVALEEFLEQVVGQRVDEIVQHQACLMEETPNAEFHELRIQLKGLRYTLEDFVPFSDSRLPSALKQLRPIQDCMGTIHDRQMWLDAVQVFYSELDSAGLAEDERHNLLQVLDLFQQEWQLEMLDQYHAFQTLWQYLERDGFWPGLKSGHSSTVLPSEE